VRALRLFLHQVRYEQLLFWRNPSSAIFTFGFPIVMLVIFASIYRDARLPALGGLPYAQYFVPGMVAFGIISACYTNLAIALCFRRDLGVLKRARGTPLPAWLFMAGAIGSALVVSVVLVVVTTGAGVLLYGVTPPARWGPLALSLAAGAFCFCALGLAITTVIPNAHAAPPVVNGLLFPLLFISGTFWPLDPASLLARVAAVFPVGHFQRAVFAAFDPRDGGAAPGALWVLAAWGLAGVVLALARFRWDPRGS
jgi:ABC-2 type transport system permease protein